MKAEITDYDGSFLYLKLPFNDTASLASKKLKEAEVRLIDGRSISYEQRKKTYALFRDIADYTGYVPEEVKEIMKSDFIARYGVKEFSLSTVDMTTASMFIEHLVYFCLFHGIPCRDSLLKYAPDISRYVYLCLLLKKCCICGKRAELHHVDHVGLGRDRNEITHVGMRAMPLSRKYHNEVHRIGQKSFEDKYHVYGVKIDKLIASKYRQIKE